MTYKACLCLQCELSENAARLLASIAKQTQMYLVVGLQFKCLGLYCFSMGWGASREDVHMDDRIGKY